MHRNEDPTQPKIINKFILKKKKKKLYGKYCLISLKKKKDEKTGILPLTNQIPQFLKVGKEDFSCWRVSYREARKGWRKPHGNHEAGLELETSV